MDGRTAATVVAKLLNTQEGEQFTIKEQVWEHRMVAGGTLHAGYHGNLAVIEQNPQKNSQYAQRARNGSIIYWAIEGSTYRWRVEVTDGKVQIFPA